MTVKKRHGAMETALNRHETFRDGFRRMGIACITMAVACSLSVGMTWWAITHKEKPTYFLAREDGGIIPLVGVSEPYLNNGQIVNFAVEAVTRSLTMSFSNYRQDMTAASEFFERPTGWNNFLSTLESSGMLEFIQNRRLVSTVVANGGAIVRQGDFGGRFGWVVQIPITITYLSSSEQSTANHVVEVEIVRIPTWQSSRAVGITRLLMK